MESAAVFRSFHHSVGTASRLKSVLEMPSLVSLNNAAFSTLSSLTFGDKFISSVNKNRRLVMSCAKISETTEPAISNDSCRKEPAGKNQSLRATFPDGFEELIRDVCDDTEIAELKLKVGDFEMHLKRSIGVPDTPVAPEPVMNHTPEPVIYHTPSPPTPSEPVAESSPAATPTSLSESSEKLIPFANVSADEAAKLAALEASGSSGYAVVLSPHVGTFRRSRIVKGIKRPPVCKEGGVIKEGQTIGFIYQFGRQRPIKSDVDGEVLKILCKDGDAVGYGDPLLVVLPSFHDINIH